MANSTIFALPEFKAYEGRFIHRVTQFTQLRRYADGSIYADSSFRLAHQLYAETKALFSFLARAVDLDIALVPGVMGPWELDEDTPDAILVAQGQLYEWSSWPIVSDEWLEDGTSLGEAMLKIVPMPGMVQLQRIKPELCMLTAHLDPQTQQTVDLALIIDRNAMSSSGERYEYAEAITPDQVRTYYNGDPHGYNGNPDRYDNPLGFVPVVSTSNDSECRPTFAKVLPQITSLNEFASYLGETLARAIDAQWAISGAEQSDLVKSGSNVWFLPSGATLEAVLAKVDVPGALSFIQEIKMETKSNLPELAFDDLRSKAQIATETLEVQLVELDAKVWKMRRRYDQGLIRAHQMAALAANLTGVQGLGPLLMPHKMDFKRPVRPISRLEQIQIEQAELGLEMSKQLASGDGMTALQGGPQMQSKQTQDNPEAQR
jgi:hypothetical protein